MIKSPTSEEIFQNLTPSFDSNRIITLMDLWAKTFSTNVYEEYLKDLAIYGIKPQQADSALSALSKEAIEQELLNCIKSAKKFLQEKKDSKNHDNTRIITFGHILKACRRASSLIRNFDDHTDRMKKASIEKYFPRAAKQWLGLIDILLHESDNLSANTVFKENLAADLMLLEYQIPILYSHSAYLLLSPKVINEINKFLGEHYIARANYWLKWKNNNVKLDELPSILREANLAYFYFAQARLALANKNMNKVEEYIDLITQDTNADRSIKMLLVLYHHIAQHYDKTEDHHKRSYYRVKVVELCSSAGHPKGQSAVKSYLDAFNDWRQRVLKSLKKTLKEEFSDFDFKIKYEHETLTRDASPFIIYLPLSILPQTAHKLKGRHLGCLHVIKVFDKEKSKNATYTGIQVRTQSNDFDDIVDSMGQLLNILYPEKKIVKEVTHSSMTTSSTRLEATAASSIDQGIRQVTTKNSPSSLPSSEPCSAPSSAASQVVKEFENLNINEAPITKRQKQKSPKQSIPATTSSPLPAIPGKMIAKNLGFTSCPDAEITPIYPSKEAQKRRDPCIFVRLKNINGASDALLKKLNEMLNPTEEGILTVGMYDEPGPKFWKYPGEEDWQHCALRFKFLGNLGKFRVIAEPEEKVEVDGKARYLFSLGYLKQK